MWIVNVPHGNSSCGRRRGSVPVSYPTSLMEMIKHIEVYFTPLSLALKIEKLRGARLVYVDVCIPSTGA